MSSSGGASDLQIWTGEAERLAANLNKDLSPDERQDTQMALNNAKRTVGKLTAEAEERVKKGLDW